MIAHWITEELLIAKITWTDEFFTWIMQTFDIITGIIVQTIFLFYEIHKRTDISDAKAVQIILLSKQSIVSYCGVSGTCKRCKREFYSSTFAIK